MSRNADLHAGAELLICNTIKGLAVHHHLLIPLLLATLSTPHLLTPSLFPMPLPSYPLSTFSQQLHPPKLSVFSIPHTHTHTHTPVILGIVATPSHTFQSCISKQFRVVGGGGTPETGWDNLAHQASTSEWQGDGTCVALIVWSGLISACPGYVPPFPPLVLDV